MNFSNFSGKEKGYLAMVCFSLVLIFLGLGYRYAWSDLNISNGNLFNQMKLNNLDDYATFVATIGGMIFIIFVHLLIDVDKSDNLRLHVGEFEIAKLRQAKSLALLIFAGLFLVFIVFFNASDNFRDHIYGRDALHRLDYQISGPPLTDAGKARAFRSYKHVMRSLVVGSMLYTVFSLNFSIFFSKLIIWLKYR